MKIKKKMFMKFHNIVGINSSRFTFNDGSGWNASTLVAEAKKQKLKPFKLYLSNVNIQEMPFKINDVYDFVVHLQRVNNSDLKYPIIMSETGLILDGWHRIVKAIVTGKSYVYAVRFENMPDMDIKATENVNGN